MQREFWMRPYGKWRKVSLTSTEMSCSLPSVLLFISSPLWRFSQAVMAILQAISWLFLRICTMKGHLCNLKAEANCFVGYWVPTGREGLNCSGHTELTFALPAAGNDGEHSGSWSEFVSFCWSGALVSPSLNYHKSFTTINKRGTNAHHT